MILQKREKSKSENAIGIYRINTLKSQCQEEQILIDAALMICKIMTPYKLSRVTLQSKTR